MGLPRVLGYKLAKLIERFLTPSFKDPVKAQEKFLMDLIRKNEGTVYGKKHGFSSIRSVRQFQERCPITEYADYEPYIDQILDGKADVLTTSEQVYWGQTSGTSGKPKLIPIVTENFKTVNIAQFILIISYIAEDPRDHSRFLDGKSCFFVANPVLRQARNGMPVGYGTGLFSSMRGGSQFWKKILNPWVYIPVHLNSIKDLDKRYRMLAKETIGKDFRSFGGVPSIIANNLEKILEFSNEFGVKAGKINDIFPEYHVSFTGGVPPKYYEKKIEAIVGHKVDFREQISATEGVIGIQLQEEPGFTPMVKSNFYEFIPVENPDERLFLGEVKKNEEYFICFSSSNGLYAYNLGDIIKFTSVDPPIFVFSRRKGVVNLVDEKLSEEDTLYAIDHVNQEFKSVLTDYTFVGMRSPDFHYHVMVEFAEKSQPGSYHDYLAFLDKYLQEANDVYRYFREDIGILKSPKMWVLKKGSFSELITERIKACGGSREQHKLPHLCDDASIVNFLEDKIESEVRL